jgi:hypothetical protein
MVTMTALLDLLDDDRCVFVSHFSTCSD